ncbi:MAG: glycosyltransferase family 4 protein [Oscillatoriales cyanobacterium C42_A2020_001]|nr:glycosyltransferase family 4 protein [Leptolyngbyaceae cyanobacterium C42_A2020_001]
MNTRVYLPRGSKSTVGNFPCIVCCASAKDNWAWLAEALDEKPRRWFFCTDKPRGLLEKVVPSLNLATIRASWQAIQTVKQQQADLLMTGNPSMSFWCAAFAILQDVKVNHVAASFYLPQMPHGLRYVLAQWVYSTIQRFIVHSRAERQFYGEYFGIPFARFEMQHRAISVPVIDPSPALEPGNYICAISQNGQDYQTLMAAMAKLPDIPLVLVVPRGRAIAAKIPPNVRLRVGLSAAAITNILYHSQFMVLSMRQSTVPCDHTSLVTAMHLGKSFVVANLSGISDYAFHNSNAVFYKAGNPASLADAIADLWGNLIKCEVLGENGREFANAFCSPEAMHKWFEQVLVRQGL